MSIKIIELYLEKRDKLSEKEKQVLLESIELMNRPIFTTGSGEMKIINPNGYGGSMNLSKNVPTN